MFAFLVLLMALASLHSLERTFGPVYDAVTDPSLLAKVDSAAVAAYARALGLFGFTFVTSLLLLSVFPLVAVPGRSLALVLGLALALLAVFAWLAISPSLPEGCSGPASPRTAQPRRRPRRSAAPSPPTSAGPPPTCGPAGTSAPPSWSRRPAPPFPPSRSMPSRAFT